MQLTYRGVKYDYNPPTVSFSQSDSVGKYRGLDVRFRNIQKVPVLQTNLDLKYRNLSYQSLQTVAPEAAPAVAPVPAQSEPVKTAWASVQDRARTLMMGNHRSIKRRQQAMLTRLDAEVGLAADNASRYWNRIQGKVHPTFRATYGRSGAALS